jgi:hypothetical protein
MAKRISVPTRTYPDGFGAHVEWGVDEDQDGTDALILNVVQTDRWADGTRSRQSVGIYLNREAIVDLIADLARALR